jgi:hypothetical protein
MSVFVCFSCETAETIFILIARFIDADGTGHHPVHINIHSIRCLL